MIQKEHHMKDWVVLKVVHTLVLVVEVRHILVSVDHNRALMVYN